MSLNKVDLVSTSAPDLLKEIQKLNKLKHYQDALSLSETATKQYPKSAALYKQNALINLKLKRVKEAHTSFMRFFKLNQDKDLIAADIYEKFFENSLKLVKKPSGKVFKEASEILSLLESIDVNGFEVALYKAAFLVVGRDYDLAVSSYDDCLQKGVAFRKTDGELYIKALFNSFRYKELDSFIRSDYALPLGELRLAKEKKRVALLLNLADAQTLASTEYYRISIFRQQSPKGVFITFGTAADDLDSEPFGMDFLLSYGYDLIFVAQENTNRYQDLSFETFEEIVAPVVKCGRYEKVYTYGVSLGGYSALYYSGCINAIAIAASPLNPWDVSLSNYVSEQVAQGKKLNYSYRLPYEQKHLRFRDIKKSDKQSFIFFDSKIEMDRIFIESQILPFLRNANTLVLDHGSHYLLTFLQKLGVLKQFVTSIVENDCFMSMVDVDFESSSIWNFQKGEWMIREANDYISGAAYLKKAVNIDQHKLAKDLLDVIAES